MKLGLLEIGSCKEESIFSFFIKKKKKTEALKVEECISSDTSSVSPDKKESHGIWLLVNGKVTWRKGNCDYSFS